MTVAYHDAFPEGYLLVLAPGEDPEASLAHHLARACGSGKPAVWVDCRLLDTLSATATWLLWACQHRLQRRQVKPERMGATPDRLLYARRPATAW